MLQRRLTVAVTAAALVVASGCGSGDTPIEDNVVRPGVTALNDAGTAGCVTNERLLLDAIDTYEVLNGGDLPADEAALVDAGLIRAESPDWDVVDGELVAENPDCA